VAPTSAPDKISGPYPNISGVRPFFCFPCDGEHYTPVFGKYVYGYGGSNAKETDIKNKELLRLLAKLDEFKGQWEFRNTEHARRS
jgi:hypothetical protein